MFWVAHSCPMHNSHHNEYISLITKGCTTVTLWWLPGAWGCVNGIFSFYPALHRAPVCASYWEMGMSELLWALGLTEGELWPPHHQPKLEDNLVSSHLTLHLAECRCGFSTHKILYQRVAMIGCTSREPGLDGDHGLFIAQYSTERRWTWISAVSESLSLKHKPDWQSLASYSTGNRGHSINVEELRWAVSP